MHSPPEEDFHAHAVCIPFPGQGHIKPMLQLAKLMAARGFYITFVNTERSHKRLLQSCSNNYQVGMIRFETIPDGIPWDDPNFKLTLASLCEGTTKNCLAPFRDLVSRLYNESPLLTCIVSDCAMSFTVDVAKESGLPVYLLWTASACGLWGYMHYRQLIERGLVPLKDETYLENGYLDEPIDWIPGMEGISLKYLPSFVRTTDPNDTMIKFNIDVVEEARKATAFIINTFDDLEHEILTHISTLLPIPIYKVGPLHMLEFNPQIHPEFESLGSSLRKEESNCLEWLDSKNPESIVFVNFGSAARMSPEQLLEFAWGLADARTNFLWITRDDLMMGKPPIFPPEFMEEIKERGLLSGWCPQEDVLKHPSIGAFLTHSGWNSTLESVGCGVPMISCPFFAEQQTNCWFACEKWGNGIELEKNAKRDEIERVVREVMEGEEGKAMKKKAEEWKKKAVGAVSIGPSQTDLDTMANVLRQASSQLYEKRKVERGIV